MDRKTEREPILPSITTSIEDVKGVHLIRGLGIWTTAILLIGEMAGSGVLALPKALGDAGWTGVAIIIGGCFVSGFNGVHLGHCWTILLERHEEYRIHVRSPYPSIAERAVGKWMRHVVSVCIYLTLFGVCTLFLILVSQNIQSLFRQVGWDLSFCVWMVILAAILTPLTWFGSPKDFWWVAIFATGSAVIACALLFVSFMIEHTKDIPHEVDKNRTFTDFFLAFGAIMFSYGGASTFPTIQHDMKEPKKFKYAVIITYILLLIMYLPPSITGYVTYGTDINSNALLTIPDGGLRITIEILITLHLFFAFVIALNPVVQEFEELLKVPNKLHWKRILLRTLTVMVILFVGESIPHFGAILSLVGGSTVTLLTFVAPSVFYLCLCSQEGEWPKRNVPLYQKVLHIEIIIVGLIGGVASTYAAVLEIVSPDTFVPPCYLNATGAGS